MKNEDGYVIDLKLAFIRKIIYQKLYADAYIKKTEELPNNLLEATLVSVLSGWMKS